MQFKIALFFLISFAIGKSAHGVISKIYGNTQNFPYIGRALATSGAASNDCTLITTRFPDEGPIYSKHVIRGIKHIEYTENFPETTIVSGGIGKKHIKIVVASKAGQTFSSNFQFYGEKIIGL